MFYSASCASCASLCRTSLLNLQSKVTPPACGQAFFRPHLLGFPGFELHLLGAGDVVDPRAGRRRVRRPGGAPHRGEGGQVAAVAQHRDLNRTWSVQETRGGKRVSGNTAIETLTPAQ